MITANYFENNRFEYFVYNAMALISYVAIVIKTTTAEKKYLAIWIGLLTFILLYFLRFYWITIDPIPVKFMLGPPSWELMILDRIALLEAFKFSVIAFTCWSTAVISSLYLQRNQVTSSEDAYPVSLMNLRPIVPYLLLFIALLSAGLAYVSAYYHIGEMGAKLYISEPLPFHLKGVIFYVRTICIPIGFLVLIYMAEKLNLQKVSRISILLLLTFAVLDMFLRNSRSPLLLALLLLLFLILSGGIRFTVREKFIFVIVTGFSFMMVPMMKVYRSIRTTENLPYLEALQKSLDVIQGNIFGQLFEGVKFIAFRMPGVESIWAMLTLHAEPIIKMPTGSWDFKGDGIAGYLSYVVHGSVHGITWGDNTLLAPGFIGWWYLISGLSGIIAGAIFIAVLTVICEKYFYRKHFLSGPIPRVVFYWMLFMVLTEGTIDYMFYMYLVASITVLFIEAALTVLARYSFKSRYV